MPLSGRVAVWGAFAASVLCVAGCHCGSTPGNGGPDSGNNTYPDGGRPDGGRPDGGDAGSPDGGGNPNGDAGNLGCGLNTCAKASANCGIIGDGCGATLQCGTCDAGFVCGANAPNVCGGTGTVCQKKTCQDWGALCGEVGDGCGDILSCGGCGDGGFCNRYQCQAYSGDAGCTGLCLQQQSCDGGATTTLTGVVLAPTDPTQGYGNPDPLPNALVYVPNAPLLPFPNVISCDVCGAPASGSPLVSTLSNTDGTFTLTNVPAGTNIPLVIQLGRWRREITLPNVAACTTTALTSDQTRMPRNQTEGSIPRIAMVTGNVDSIECVLRKMGIADSEFTAPSPSPDAGRVQFFVANGASDPTGRAPGEGTLTGSPSTLNRYDLTIFACVGSEVQQSATAQQNIINYTSNGGRVYASHYSYVWLFNDAPFSSTALWDVNRLSDDNLQDVQINTSFPKGAELAQWLTDVGASTTPGVIPLAYLRHDFDVSNAPSETWVFWDAGVVRTGRRSTFDAGVWPLHYTFNTPVDAGTQCGRVVFSDFHVENAQTQGQTFPSECPTAPMTAQEKVLEYMLFDLTSCVQSGGAGSCVPLSCGDQGFGCGLQGDTCGNIINCGGCDGGEACGAGGTPGVCGGGGVCNPRDCGIQGFNCGQAGDGCGNVVNCGVCDGGLTCGGGGQANVCGTTAFQ